MQLPNGEHAVAQSKNCMILVYTLPIELAAIRRMVESVLGLTAAHAEASPTAALGRRADWRGGTRYAECLWPVVCCGL